MIIFRYLHYELSRCEDNFSSNDLPINNHNTIDQHFHIQFFWVLSPLLEDRFIDCGHGLFTSIQLAYLVLLIFDLFVAFASICLSMCKNLPITFSTLEKILSPQNCTRNAYKLTQTWKPSMYTVRESKLKFHSLIQIPLFP